MTKYKNKFLKYNRELCYWTDSCLSSYSNYILYILKSFISYLISSEPSTITISSDYWYLFLNPEIIRY